MLDTATMITAGTDRDAAVLLSTAAILNQPVAEVGSARLTATAHGVYEAAIKGTPSDSVLNPGWIGYEWRLQTQQFDVTDLVADSAEVCGWSCTPDGCTIDVADGTSST